MKIKTRLAICFVGIATLPVLLISGFAISSLRQQAIDNFVDSSTREIRQVDTAFTQYFNDIGENVRFFAKHPNVHSMDGSVTKYLDNPGNEMTPDTNGGVESDIFKLFDQFGSTHPAYAYIYTGNKEGGFIQWPKGKVMKNYDPRKRPWYESAMKEPGKLVMTEAYYWAPDDAVIVSTVQSLDTTLGTNSGAIGIDVSMKKLTDVVKRIKIGDSGYLMMVENSGTVLVDPSKPASNFKKLAELGGAYQVLANSTTNLEHVEIDGTAYMANIYQSPKLGWRFIGLTKESEVYAAANKVTLIMLVATAVLAILFGLAGYGFAGLIVKPIQRVSQGLREMAQGEGDLTKTLPVKGNDETAELASLFNQFLASIRTLVSQISQTASEVKQVSADTSKVSGDMANNARRQSAAVDQTKSACHEVASSSHDVAQACNQAASAADSGSQYAHAGEALIGNAVSQVSRLNQEIRQAADVISRLDQNSQDISQILGTIQNLAEQTNLLALNAAIEAARAGEQGRGFAVVADEVRKLAERTASSTLEIKTMLDRLTSGTQQVVITMSASRETSDTVFSSIEKVTSNFGEILEAVAHIRDMNIRIATAAQEQNQAANNIDHNMGQLHEEANRVAEVSEHAHGNAARLETLADNLKALVGRFKV
ncbi:methyl-accepting chemotaxis protein [Leeia sp. TBRC 13508]|uniref:Methyl-accepting chemotaxis protein n=1 Tax=Leeia speluncae TaxID=2884804 RepID=A0ABS8D1H3_9NEIS|nr:methyl-accepting chemotaxis protein [Leeia speluncae]MCB6182042.1 methyl-accepting chemotaxis protein [Leeia speluncae]